MIILGYEIQYVVSEKKFVSFFKAPPISKMRNHDIRAVEI